MAVSFSNVNCHTRSASFPPKSNPMAEKNENELKKLGKSEELSTSEMETISIGLSGMARLYKCVYEALKLGFPRQTLLPHHMSPLVESSSKLLSICTTSNQMLATLREAVANVRSTLEADSHEGENEGSSMSSYLRARKEMIRTAKGVALSLKDLESEVAENLGHGQDESEVSRVMTCVTIINISVLGSLFRFLMTKPAKQGLLHKLGLTKKLSGKAATLPSKNGNKLSDVDAALLALFAFPKDADTLAVALKRMESMEMALSELEDGLSLLFTVLNKIKSSLHKIISL